jgi:hypothetical protein
MAIDWNEGDLMDAKLERYVVFLRENFSLFFRFVGVFFLCCFWFFWLVLSWFFGVVLFGFKSLFEKKPKKPVEDEGKNDEVEMIKKDERKEKKKKDWFGGMEKY